ncbi:MAG: LysR family transcriptional regulator [Sedimentisphaerales bacterium]|nr:LysR family transcriptional regulator [Sedimentisphaerales bacterium]
MNIETLKIFCDLVELQNFSRTAEKHGISQSAVSQQLAQLEVAHKCQFLNRKKRPPELTQAGEIFYLAARDIQDRYDRLIHELATLSRPGSRIRIAAIFSIGMHTLQPYVTRFMAKYPTVHLRIEYGDAEEIYDRLLKGEIDLGVVAVPKKMRHIDVYPFEDEPLVLVCSPDHPLAGAGSVDIHKLQGMEFIAFEKDVPTRNWIDSVLFQYNVNPRIVLEFDNIETIKRAVEINSGISILPETTIRTELVNQTLRAMPFSNERFYRPTGVIVRKNRVLTQAGRYLIELLQKSEHGHEHDSGRDI